MEWLTNLHDPRRIDHDAYIKKESGETMQEAKERQQRFLQGKIIGKPKASSAYTVEQLEAMHTVGIYQKTEV